MLNGNEENEYRHRPEYMEFVGYIIFSIIVSYLIDFDQKNYLLEIGK